MCRWKTAGSCAAVPMPTPPALSCFGRDGVPLSNGAADNTRTVFAYRCADCKKVIIDYD